MEVPRAIKSIGCILFGAGMGCALFGYWEPALVAVLYAATAVWIEKVRVA